MSLPSFKDIQHPWNKGRWTGPLFPWRWTDVPFSVSGLSDGTLRTPVIERLLRGLSPIDELINCHGPHALPSTTASTNVVWVERAALMFRVRELVKQRSCHSDSRRPSLNGPIENTFFTEDGSKLIRDCVGTKSRPRTWISFWLGKQAELESRLRLWCWGFSRSELSTAWLNVCWINICLL